MATRNSTASSRRPAARKNPAGGLTAAGRRHFKKTEGANLKPGVQGKADTPEKMKRKGSFLRRHYGHAPSPLKDDDGQPTRYALQARAWGEPVPKTRADVKKLADKGTKLLERYEKAKGDDTRTSGRSKASKK